MPERPDIAGIRLVMTGCLDGDGLQQCFPVFDFVQNEVRCKTHDPKDDE